MAEIKSILFPTDFSETSNRAFAHAAALAEAYGARIVMLHVSELEEADPANPAHDFPPAGAFSGEIERLTVRGHAPYKDILEVSREKGCDLIVMATHGRSELAQLFMGRSVTEDVSSFSEAPVYVIPPGVSAAPARPAQFNHVLVARGSARARAAADALAQRFSAQVHEVAGDDADEIVRHAGETGADLIVISAGAEGGLGEELSGSVADHVLQHAPCPVLTVRD